MSAYDEFLGQGSEGTRRKVKWGAVPGYKKRVGSEGGRQCRLRAAGGAVVRPRRPQYRAAATARRSLSAMRALLPLLSFVRGWRVGAAARPPRRVMSLYRTEERGHPHSEDYRLFFSKWLAELRAGPRSSRATVSCPAGSAPAPSPG